MKKFWIAICFVFFLLFTGGITETVLSMDIEEIEAVNQTSDETSFIDGNIFHNIFATIETNTYSQFQQGVNTPRVKRAVSLQISSFFKNLSRSISKLDSAFALHNEHLYNTTINHFICEPLCKHYYVFALRHIII